VTARPATAVVVGGSLAGLGAVRAFREQGFDGRLVMIGEESERPYDRPPLSKAFLTGAVDRSGIDLVDGDELERLEVEHRVGVRATGLRPADRTILLAGDELVADLLVIATGARPRRLAADAYPAGVHTLRTVADAEALRTALVPGVAVVVVGGGFIGSEVASAACLRGADVTVVELLEVPLALTLGVEVGSACAALHAANGVSLRTGVGMVELSGRGQVSGVVLSDGSELAADLVVVGIGVRPATDWLVGSGLALDDGVLTDGAGLTGIPGVAAVGDVARPAGPWTAGPVRVEHWTNAFESPARAVSALLGTSPRTLPPPAPYFWSDQYGSRIQFAGHREPGDRLRLVEGDLASPSFVAVYEDGEQVGAVVAVNGGRTFTGLRRQLVARHSAVSA
jgi:3-phenylpropionate/trans-cinnamate dioxygenase ferredoxin reductase component